MVEDPESLSLVCVFHGLAGVAVRLPGPAVVHSGARQRHEEPAATGVRCGALWWICYGDFCGGMGHWWPDFRCRWRPDWPCANTDRYRPHVFRVYRAVGLVDGMD